MSSLWGLGLRGGDLQQLTQLALTLGALAGAVGASARCEHGDQHEDDRQHADQSCGQPVGGGQRRIAPIDQTHQIGRIGAAETVEERLVGERLAEGRTAAGLELAAGAGLLVEHRGQAVPHRSLLVEIWGREHADDRPLLRSHVSNLRRKTEPPGECRRIRTEPDVGYRFGS